MNIHLQRISNGLSNIPGIAESWKNEFKESVGLLSEKEQQVIAKRLDICGSCIFNSIKAKEIGYNNDTDYHCSVCKCPINTRVKSFTSNCGMEWFIFNPDDSSVSHVKEYFMSHNEPIELKWTKE